MFVHIAFVRRCASYAWAESAASSRTHTPCTTVRTHRIYLYAYNVYDRTHTTSMTIRIQTQRQSVLPVCTMSCIYRGRECCLCRGRVCCLCAIYAEYGTGLPCCIPLHKFKNHIHTDARAHTHTHTQHEASKEALLKGPSPFTLNRLLSIHNHLYVAADHGNHSRY